MSAASWPERCAERVLEGQSLGRAEALALLAAARDDPWPLLFAADRIRRRFRGRTVRLCGIAAVKLGRCGEDCRWCAQSAHWSTDLVPRGLPPADQLLAAARAAAASGAGHFGLVSSGGRLSEDERREVCRIAGRIRRETGLAVCGSFGALSADEARALADAGFVRYNHNLETSARHFPRVCTTHTYEDRMRSARAAVAGGLELCSGGIFGVGEDDADRVDLALAIRDLGPEVVPLNFLHPIPGTPLADAAPLAPLEILAIVALFRFVLPDRTIKLAGGRERNLRDLQALMFMAGADSAMIGNYLTTAGRPVAEDLAMIRDLGLVPEGQAGPRAAGGKADG